MAIWSTVLICVIFAVGQLIFLTQAANVALFKPATANATCGSSSESYYPVVQRTLSLRNRKLLTCDASNRSLSHNASKMVDGNLITWWQSPASVDKISITIDFRGQYQKYYYAKQFSIKFGEYYRPGQLAFYKSSDYGLTYKPWHYFVSSVDECQEKFNVEFKNKPLRVDDVLCMEYPTESVDRNDVVSMFVVGARGDLKKTPSDKLLVCRNIDAVFYTS